MPSRTYRRRLRVDKPNAYISVPAVLGGCGGGDNELLKIQQYFYNVLNMIIEHKTFNEIKGGLLTIIGAVKSHLDYYKILDIIEGQLLTIAINVGEGVSPGIILTRIEYIRTFIDSLPPNCLDASPIAIMVLELIDLITSTLNFNNARKNIAEIQAFIEEKYGQMAEFQLIQESIISVICNIGEGTTPGIVETRVEYIRCLIAELDF
jgi:hypothetical protein